MSHIKIIFLVHFVLALAPIGMRFAPPNVSALPVIWALASVNVAQLMLLSIYVAIFAGDTRYRLLVATLGVIYIGICQVIGQLGMDSGTPLISLGGAYLRYVGADAGIFVVLTGVLVRARKAVGSIRRVRVIPPRPVATRPQFSLLTILLVLSMTALVMGLVRSSRMADEPGHTIAYVVQYVLFAIVFGTNIVATVWATLGTGSIPGKLTIVFAVSGILGLSIGVSARHDTIGWWLLASSPLLTLIPTVIVALTLLSLRPLGFRLTRLAADTIAMEA